MPIPSFPNDGPLDGFDDEPLRVKDVIHFESLANSAFDFLQKAFGEVSTDPKYSVMHFYNGIELLFKARLLHEHWTLVVSKPESASLIKFKSGDFKSVTLQEAIQRLQNVAEEPVSKEESSCYEQVGNHRNQIVHFFHKGYVGETPDAAVVGEVAAEQFRAWVYVHRRLTRTWSDHFGSYLDSIHELNELIKGNRQFLTAKLAVIKPEIQKLRSAGSEVVACDSCGLDAAIVEESEPPLRESRCLVCERVRSWIIMECPECEAEVVFEDGEGVCSNCETEYSLTDLLERFGTASDPREEPDDAYCPDCERTDRYTVVPHGDGYICLNCAATFSRVSHCGWCSERVAGVLEDSYLAGCLMCEGRFGNDKD